MEPLTVILTRLLRQHPISVPYVIACVFVVLILGLHPW